MKKSILLTIGIPAYNEATNIGSLLRAILSQKLTDKEMEIIVISDGSTDATVTKAKKITDSRIKVIEQKKRLGKNAILNKLTSLARGVVFVQLDADVFPVGPDFLETLVGPVLKENADLVAADIQPVQPRTLIEYFTFWGQKFKTTIYRRINNGDTIYLCYGRARAFSRKIYKHLKWPNSCPEDSYSYLFCLQNKGKFVYQRNAVVLFRCPANFSDYLMQSSRFIIGKSLNENFFPFKTVQRAYQIRTNLVFRSFYDLLQSNLISTLFTGTGYIMLTLYRKLFSTQKSIDPAEYDYLSTTKELE